ncbi:MAG: CopG family transcriptional regulator [Acidimicrobiales bacterium]|nr:CopG family transcriptional regulator [Acidimicrobiales bacterium]
MMVALAADLHRRLRAQAEAQGVFKADVVVDAYDHYAEALRREHHAASAGLHPRARRRRSVEDATQCQLYLTDEERGRIDNLAMEIGLSRSELASRLLERALSPASS